ncbi:NUDIX hydrolase [Candidatus Kaiserbacteria bacterium]|nr:NUDIX hydrolase [Candidatus Kaiserbacteria bacterium]MCB9812358.1 NUDIX hydrolase [Candidatus Nomurabacteria bacterium]
MKLFVGAKAVIQRSDGKVLIVREGSAYEEGTNIGKWDVPGGRIEADEALLAGLAREVKEEAGLEVEVGEVLYAADNFPEIKGEKAHVVRIYFACTTTKQEIVLSKDHDEHAWVDQTDIEKYAVMEDAAIAIRNLQ